MPSDLLSIGKSGAKAARIALDLTAQNIANASSEGYVRRTASLAEVSSAGGFGRVGDVSLSGVRLQSVVRNADLFRQAEVRRTGADAARANAEVAGLENIESAVEQTGVYPAIVQFEASLQRLVADPVSASLRTAALEDARTMARTFTMAAAALDTAGQGLRFEAADGVEQVNLLTGELARVNLRLARAADASSDQSTLLDQRDALLEKLSGQADVAVTFNADHTVEVRLGGTAGAVMVAGGTAGTLAMTTAADGTIAFAANGTPLSLTGGALAGKALALDKLADVRTRLDTVALSVIDTVNTAQAGGVALDGTPGQPLFAGTGAASMAIAATSGAAIATAPAGAPAGSRNGGNLQALRSALATANPAGGMDALLFDVSSTVAGRSVTRDALAAIADGSRTALQAQAGVSLDDEAVNLVRYQQAFQASGRVMQVASDIFDTLLQIR